MEDKKKDNMELDNLTQLQKAAIEGEVAKAYSSAKHNEEILYRFYTMLKSAPKDTVTYIIEITQEMIEIKEELINRVILETSSDEPPVWLWINKLIADIKLSLKLATSDGLICDIEADKKLMQQKIIKSAFIVFVRKAAIVCTRAARELCRYIIDEEPLDLDFLADTCFALIAEIDELPVTEKMPDSLFHSEFDIRNMLSFRMEKEIIEKRNKRDEIEKESERQAKDISKKLDNALNEAIITKVNQDDSMDATVYAVRMAMADKEGFMADAVSGIMKQILNEQLKTPKAMKTAKYAVIKEYANSPVSTTLKSFDTEEEAESYKEKIEKGFPELMKSCTLRIKKFNAN